MNNRVQNLIAAMKEKGITDVLITDPKNMHYYSGFKNGEGYLLIGDSGFRVVTDSRYSQYAADVCKGFEVCDITSNRLSGFLGDGAALGFEDKHMTYAEYVGISGQVSSLVPIGDMAIRPREVKEFGEIESITKAATIADKAFEHMLGVLKEGITEKQAAAELDCFMKKNGAEKASFDTIVAAGERGSLPHAIASERTLRRGDLVVMDFGCVVNGYASDMTRTVAIGDVSSSCEDVYNTVLSAQLKALSLIKSGAIASEVDASARNIINERYSGRFGHALGHSVGLDIHEAPNLSPKNQNPLVCGNVVTVEPGIYIPGFCGVRIEDLVVVTDEGYVNLTHSPKELIRIG